MTAIWAHRGSRLRAPENTMPAFELAVAEGADGIELDVHLTADGRLVVCHDPTVTLLDGSTALIRDLTFDAVRGVDLGNETSGAVGIPELHDVFELLAPTSLVLNIEVKNGPILYAGIEEAVIAAHRASGMAERIVYSSFNHLTLVALREREPSAAIAPLYEEALVDPWAYVLHMGANAAHPYYPTLGLPGMIEGFAAAGVAVRAWTVNDEADMRALIGAGIDAIVTDDPTAALKVRAEFD
ncbi:glycerophosphodiester phosphodiesterase family protein [Demequina lutea]|uniref:Glycerophosphoryl diester phosphodiesterase n=1 Tax=Demequina lutea TaxID=431489 RepID=A0A7Z0CKE9_9MICO|nr:glycerophosphodiester phosphodiesterase family protein [Demequina lutea]NYI41833.1 glycerophosphoryl diester phosphodiesterase [Demequina lutea]